MAKEKEILTRFLGGESQRSIAAALGVSRNTVAKMVDAFRKEGLDADAVEKMSRQDLAERLFPSATRKVGPAKPDFEHIHRELLRPGVNLKLLWGEYSMDCRQTGLPFLSYSQFCKQYSSYVDQHRLTMHIRHKPGDRLMVDWAGTAMPLYNPVTGVASKAYLFVATLPFSMYCYAEACRDMKEESWLNAHVHAFEAFGGTTRLLVPDNLKAGIISHRKYEDFIANASYQEMANHYHIALLPARVLAPKDKAAVEGCVGQLTTHVIARLRNRKFTDLAEMNKAIWAEVKAFNDAPFQKRDGSRTSVFEKEELPALHVLPAVPYEYAHWKRATVQINYHITLDYQNYSVPYKYARQKVDVRYTGTLVEIFSNGNRIASHARLRGAHGQYSTITEHMPPNHQLYSEWDGARFRRWAKKIGSNASLVISRLLGSYVVEEQAYKGCLLMLNLAGKYGSERLETACGLALQRTPVPRYQLVNHILAHKEDLAAPHVARPNTNNNANAFVRGASYYGGSCHEN